MSKNLRTALILLSIIGILCAGFVARIYLIG